MSDKQKTLTDYDNGLCKSTGKPCEGMWCTQIAHELDEIIDHYVCKDCDRVIDPCSGCGDDHDPENCITGFNSPVL